MSASATDIRCTLTIQPAGICGSQNAAASNDYVGELQTRIAMRVTDRNNLPNPGGPGPGTVSDTPFSFTEPCSQTADIQTGSNCTTATTANAVAPGIVTAGRRSNWELGPVEVYDGGPDGVASTTGDNTLFLDQGIFIP